MEKNGVIIAIGSACNTSLKKASHVLYALGVNDVIKKNTIRVSWCDYTKVDDINRFLAVLVGINKHSG